ncbi:MAG: type II secretion system protein [Lawsonibacter sp.]
MRAKRTSRGETLVETLAAILVVSLTSVFLLTSVMAAQRVNRQAGEGTSSSAWSRTWWSAGQTANRAPFRSAAAPIP